MRALATYAILVASPAAAQNVEVTVALTVEHRLGSEGPLGVRLSASPQMSLAPRCGRRGDPQCGPSSIWPIVAPEIGVGLHGRAGALDLRAGLGLASVEPYHVGWIPYFEALAQVGAQWQTGRKGVGTLLGGTLNKSLSPYFVSGSDPNRPNIATEWLSLRVDVHSLILKDSQVWQVGAGLQSVTYGYSEFLL